MDYELLEGIPEPPLAGQDVGSVMGKPGGRNAQDTDPSEHDRGRSKVSWSPLRNSWAPGVGELKTCFILSSFTCTWLKLADLLGLVSRLLLLDAA